MFKSWTEDIQEKLVCEVFIGVIKLKKLVYNKQLFKLEHI